MEDNDDIRKEINEWAPGFPAKPTITPPEDYFSALPDRILRRWKEESIQPVKRRIRLKHWMAAAAITTGVLIGGWCWLKSSTGADDLPEITGADAFAYVQDNIDEFEDLLHNEAVWPEQTDLQIQDSTVIEEYLLEELQHEEIEQLF